MQTFSTPEFQKLQQTFSSTEFQNALQVANKIEQNLSAIQLPFNKKVSSTHHLPLPLILEGWGFFFPQFHA